MKTCIKHMLRALPQLIEGGNVMPPEPLVHEDGFMVLTPETIIVGNETFEVYSMPVASDSHEAIVWVRDRETGELSCEIKHK